MEHVPNGITIGARQHEATHFVTVATSAAANDVLSPALPSNRHRLYWAQT
jgi:hypothetical protein